MDTTALTRRTALVALSATLVSTSGCSLTTAPPSPRETLPATQIDPDVAVAVSVLGRIRDVRSRIVGSQSGAGLSPRALSQTLAAHEAKLTTAVPASLRPTASPSAPAHRLSVPGVRKEIRGLQAALVDGAQGARSGAFALLLASMNAALAQHLHPVTRGSM